MPAPVFSNAPTAISATRRFVVSGLTSIENVNLAASAEEVAEKVEAVVGLPLPLTRYQPMHLLAREGEGGRGQVIKAQGWVDRRLTQKLIIVNPVRADQEDVLEGLCWLLLNRYVINKQTFEQRARRLGTVPDWLSVGVAQNAYLALRSRNSQVVVQRWRAGDAMVFADILNLEYLPPGRWGEKAFSGVAVDWLASQPKPGAVFDALFSTLAEGQRIAPEQIAGLVTGSQSLRDLEKGWDLWIAQQTLVRRNWGGVSPEQIAALKQALIVQPAVLGVDTGRGVPAAMRPIDLIESCDQRWMAPLAVKEAFTIRSLGIGEAQEFRDVAERYGLFFDALARRSSAWFARLRFSKSKLRSLLDQADRALDEFQQLVGRREQYVSDAEGHSTALSVPASVSNTVSAMERFIPRSELQKYVDGIEEQNRK